MTAPWALGLAGKLPGDTGDAEASRKIEEAHDWLQRWWGADTSSSAYRHEKFAGDVAGLFVGGGEARSGLEAVEAGARLAEDGEAVSTIGAASRAALKAAENPDLIFVKDKHISIAPGTRWAKFASEGIDEVRAWVAQALKSDAAIFRPNDRHRQHPRPVLVAGCPSARAVSRSVR